MLQNKFIFNQSSVSLEIIGLPDFSNNENKDQISIISQWKLKIIDMPLIEGSLDHLKSVMDAFYTYSRFLLNEETPLYKSTLIDIKTLNYVTHEIILKSSKPNVDPLNIKIGNSVLSDIVNCFDQMISSNKVKKIYVNDQNFIRNKGFIGSFNNCNITSFLLPPLISICSLFIISLGYIYFYNSINERENKTHFLDSKNRLISINPQTR